MTIRELKEAIENTQAKLKDDTTLDSKTLSALRKELFENFKLTGFANS